MPGRLKNKVAIVTGGGTGIGRGIAKLFAREGARVVICGRTGRTLQRTVKAMTDAVGRASYVICDVSKADQVAKMVEEAVRRYGKLDILVNNAGISLSGKTILELTEEEWQRAFDINAKGSWLCSKYAIPEMRKAGGGSIIMVSSISAYVGQQNEGCYNATKAAQELLMKCMALDFAKDGIRVNSICPAWVTTELNRQMLAALARHPKRAGALGLSYSDLLKLHPMGRIGTPEDCAWAAVYLASDESKWVTGTAIFVDGGYTCQ